MGNKPTDFKHSIPDYKQLRIFQQTRLRTILELFSATGVRRTEMPQLVHGDYDPTALTLLIRLGKNGKTGCCRSENGPRGG